MNIKLLIGIIFIVKIIGIESHGRLLDPISRSSAWRKFGSSSFPVNTNDNQMFCGGSSYQWQRNKGKCGICGDPWDQTPRAYEKGGAKYVGTSVKTYEQGDVIDATVEITANHLGYFEFRVCPVGNGEATQDCLDQNLLTDVDGNTRISIGSRTGQITVRLKLPAGLTCDHCVFQWKYNTGNSWGVGKDGVGCLGCGQQEQFYGCSDITIEPKTGHFKKSYEDVHDHWDMIDPVPEEPQSPDSSSTLLKRLLNELKRLKSIEREANMQKRVENEFNQNEYLAKRKMFEKDLMNDPVMAPQYYERDSLNNGEESNYLIYKKK